MFPQKKYFGVFSIYLQKSASIQSRKSPVKFGLRMKQLLGGTSRSCSGSRCAAVRAGTNLARRGGVRTDSAGDGPRVLGRNGSYYYC